METSSRQAPSVELPRTARAAVLRVPWDDFCLATLPDQNRYVSAALHGLPPAESVATLVDALGLEPDDRVLHVGTGTGYTTAVLAQMVPDGEVFTIDRQTDLVGFARGMFEKLGYTGIQSRVGDGLAGWPEEGPFDAILIGFPFSGEPPRDLLGQLGPGGRLVLPIGRPFERPRIVRFVRRDDDFEREELQEVRLVSLLGDLLVEMGAAERRDVEAAAELALTSGRKIGEELGRIIRLHESDLYRALAIQRGLRFASVEDLIGEIDLGLVDVVPRAFLEHNQLIPIARSANHTIQVATHELQASAGVLAGAFPDCRHVDVILVTPTDYRRLWRAVDLGLERKSDGVPPEAQLLDDVDLVGESDAREARFIGLLDSLLLDAVAERASDIHFERYGDRVRVRLRVDGELRDLEHYALTPRDLVGLVNVIKVRADLDIAERRLPQGGRIKLRAGGKGYDLRVQTQPSMHGEHVVIRLLPQNVKLLSVEDLGFPPDVANQYMRLLDSPNGLILVVGPTGSGKSTTLYAGLQVLARDGTRKVITVEDPIEYSIDDVQQTQVRPEIGFQFANAMRAFVREDPDVILVGEIRDHETALEAVRASQTGHVVLSTLHCNDAVDAVQRLFDLDVHANSISSELLAVVAQRLAKRVCEGCRRRVDPDPEILAELFPDGDVPEDFECWEGEGCDRCGGHGTHGRIAVIEFLRTLMPVRAAISRRPPVDELRLVARQNGLVTMRESALQHVRAGRIPLSELPRILPAERMAPEPPLE